MDMKDIKKLETVRERLEARGPSGVSTVHCLFCGALGRPWFSITRDGNGGCDCQDAQDARSGKGPKPRVIERGGKMYIILEPPVIDRMEALGYKRFKKLAEAIAPSPAKGKPPVPAVPGVQKGAAGIVPKRKEVDHEKASEWLAKAVEDGAVNIVNTEPVHAELQTDDIVNSVNTGDASVNTEPVHADEEARKAYRAEWMRRKRERDRAAKDQP